jgi:translation initiation factor 1 (eIF-1/SUI1)
LPTRIAQVKSKCPSAVIKKCGEVLLFEPFEKIMHVIKVIITERLAFGRTVLIILGINSRKNINLHNVANTHRRIDWPLTEITRIVKHVCLQSLSK